MCWGFCCDVEGVRVCREGGGGERREGRRKRGRRKLNSGG